MKRGRPATNHERLVVRFPADFITQIKAEAKARGMSVSALMREAFENRVVMLRR